MLTSPNDGERANAALLASRMLAEFDLDWREVVRRALMADSLARKVEPDAWTWGSEHQYRFEIYEALLAWDGLGNWERDFVRSLRDREPFDPTEKQRNRLDWIIYRYNREHGYER